MARHALMLIKAKIGGVVAVAAGLVWAGAVALGTRALLNYETKPAAPGAPPAQWPSKARISRPAYGFSLVIFAHPQCPCTRASLAELESVMAQVPVDLTVFVVFSKPGADAAEVRTSDLWKRAASIPGVRAIYDERGEETERFGVLASGQTMLYDPQGSLIFSGGITAARGHVGSNYGVDAVVSLVQGRTRAEARAPVFGCSLRNPGAETLKEDASWKKQ